VNGSFPFTSKHLGIFRFEDVGGALERLSLAQEILKDHGNHDQLTVESGSVILNDGMKWAATYFVIVLALFCIGVGRYTSIDVWR